MQTFSDEFRTHVRRKPISPLLIAVLAAAAFAVIGEFSVGFVDGVVEGLADGR